MLKSYLEEQKSAGLNLAAIHGAPLMNVLVVLLYADFIVIDLLFQSIAVDAEHLSGLYLIAIIGAEGQLEKGLLDLFNHDVVQTIQFNLSFFLLRKENFQLALYKFLQADGLKVSNEKIVRTV
jgi:hypothetical protein